MKPMVVSRCFLLSAMLFSQLLFAGATDPALAVETKANSLPLMFDLRERIAKPDLKSVPRLRFLTTVNFPPFNFIDQSGKLSGFHVDLAREICRELNILERCQIEAVTYENLQKALDDGEGDVIAAGVRIDSGLRDKRQFSRVFMQLPARFVTLKRRVNEYKTPAGLKDATVGVVGGTSHAAMLARFFPDLKSRNFNDRTSLLRALKNNEIAAIFGDGMQLSFWLEGEDAANCCALLGGPYYSRAFLGEGLALVTRKEDKVVKTALDQALIALARSGRLNEIYLRYFPGGL